jgi:drug/metabolite transporter (DMT)-like permease
MQEDINKALSTTAVSSKSSSRLTQGYLICLGATFILATTAIFIRYLTEKYRLPPLVLAFWRELFVFTALFLVLAVVRPVLLSAGRKNIRFLVFYGLLLSLFNSLWTFSVALNGAAVATVLVYSSTAFTAILGRMIFSEELGRVKILAVIFSLAGMVLVSGAYIPGIWQVNLLGILTGSLAGLGYAGYSLMGRASANRQINPWTALLYIFGFGSVFLLAYNLLPGLGSSDMASSNLTWLGKSLAGWGVLAFLAVGPTLTGYGLYTVSLGYLPASVANLIASLEPVITAALAYIILGEMLSPLQLLGSVLIIAGVVILRISEGQAVNKAPVLSNQQPPG